MKKLLLNIILIFAIVSTSFAHTADIDFIAQLEQMYSRLGLILTPEYKKKYRDYWHERRGGFAPDGTPIGVDQGIQSFVECIGKAKKAYERVGLVYKHNPRDNGIVDYIHNKPADPCLIYPNDVDYCEGQLQAALVTSDWARIAREECEADVWQADAVFDKAFAYAVNKLKKDNKIDFTKTFWDRIKKTRGKLRLFK